MAARRLAIVTGGNRGIGREIARQLLKHDLFVAVGCRSQDKCAATIAELGGDGETLAAEVAGSGILVNSMSPGWVRTDMGGPEAPRDVAEGADTAVWLALLPTNGPTGQFFRDRKAIPW